MDGEVSEMLGMRYCYGVMMMHLGSGFSFLVRNWSERKRLKPVRVIEMMGAEPGG